MKFEASLLAGVGLFFVVQPADAKPKTILPEPVKAKQVEKSPYRYNGVVQTANARGSGFCAWNRRTFFTAAHVVYDGESWGAPPFWAPAVNDLQLGKRDGFWSRGYYRWADYAKIVAEEGNNNAAFGIDTVVGFSFRKLVKGRPAPIDIRGGHTLTTKVKSTITGYPAQNPYKDKNIEGYYLHQTEPSVTPYRSHRNGSLITPLITTGPGNSGGPVWTKQKKRWKASGVLVGGLPSETVVCPFTSETNSLLRAVKPIVSKKSSDAIGVNGVGATSYFFPYNKRVKLPDGATQWTNFRVGVKAFERDSITSIVRLSLDIRTKHRGDLQVMLTGTDGAEALIHNEGGAGKDNLIIKDMDLSEAFAGVDPNGTWILRVQDRLKGDVCTLRSFRLEIGVEDPTFDGSGDGGTVDP